jgi:hypothetical protein
MLKKIIFRIVLIKSTHLEYARKLPRNENTFNQS